MNFSEMSKQLRKEKNISQAKLAKELQVSNACIAMIETGKNEPTANTLMRYADYFQVSTDYLLGRSDDFGNITVKVNKVGEFIADEEKKILTKYRDLSYPWKMRVQAYVDVAHEMYSEENHKKKKI